jgi:hypothetical protein
LNRFRREIPGFGFSTDMLKRVTARLYFGLSRFSPRARYRVSQRAIHK